MHLRRTIREERKGNVQDLEDKALFKFYWRRVGLSYHSFGSRWMTTTLFLCVCFMDEEGVGWMDLI